MHEHNKNHIWETFSQDCTQQAKTKSFPLKIKNMTRCLLSPLSFNIVLEVLSTVIRQEKEIKCIQIRKEAVKLSLFSDDLIVYIENSIVSTKKMLDLICVCGKIKRSKLIFRNWRHFCIPTMNYNKKKLGKKSHFL